jgi:rod shape determining protein RodA
MDNIKRRFKNLDFIIFLTMAILICIGLYCIRQVGIVNNDKDGLYIKQIMGVVIGLVIVFVILLIDYHIICNLSYILYIGIIIILAFLLKFGVPINNVKRWIKIAGIPFQPSELTKVVLILFLAFLCNQFKDKLGEIYVFFILATVTALPILLIILEPHLSSSMAILFIACVIVYSSGISYKIIAIVLAIIIPIVVGIVIAVTVFRIELPFIKLYQIERIFTFMSTDQSEDATGKYQQNQALTSIASGGRNGKMILENNSTKKYTGIYANESDFIFSVVGEEFGFIGTSIIILLYFILIFRCLIIAAHAPDYMGKLICTGVSSLLMFQTVVNIGVATSLLPNTGLSLPFISYGLTSLISSMLAVGLVLNIGLKRNIGFYHMNT